MDRPIVYAGSIPLDTDLLRSGQYTKEALGRVLDSVYGQNVSSAMALPVTLSASALSLTVGPGIVNAWNKIDTTSIGAQGAGLATNGSGVTNQYLNETTQTVTIPSAGATYGIYAICSEQDTDNTVLPYYNSTNPSQTQAGPNNAGTALPTRRTGTMSFIAATTAPTAATGQVVVELYTVTVPSGATNLSAATLTALSVFYPTIPQLKPGRLIRVVEITGTQLYAPSANCASFEVELWGAGGASGGAASNSGGTSASVGTPGGGGGYARFRIDRSIQTASSFTVTIGSGGVGGIIGVGGTGGTSSFGSLVTCNGGAGGNTSGSVANGTAYWGGQSVGGAVTINAATGLSVVLASKGINGESSFIIPAASGSGTPVPFCGAPAHGGAGTGGNNGITTTDNGTGSGLNAFGYGSGGGGCGSVGTGSSGGGNGAPGLCIIREYT